ncbi:MAG: hypothetical protein AAFY28_07920, partial [Actinomycetota bacterium]
DPRGVHVGQRGQGRGRPDQVRGRLPRELLDQRAGLGVERLTGDEATHDGVPEQRPPDIARMAEAAPDYGCTILGPPHG